MEHYVGTSRAPHRVEWLSDNRSAYVATPELTSGESQCPARSIISSPSYQQISRIRSERRYKELRQTLANQTLVEDVGSDIRNAKHWAALDRQFMNRSFLRLVPSRPCEAVIVIVAE